MVTDLSNITKTKYAGNYIYEETLFEGISNGEELKFFNQPEGYVEPEDASNYDAGFNYVYQYKDHLGNIRLSYKDISTTSTPILQIVEENNYYPFGLKHKGYNNNINGVEHKYKYNNKELQDELGLNWYDYGARNYDAALGRFFGLDKFAEKFESLSPYQYANNTPTLFIDKNGEYIYLYLGEGKNQKELRYNAKKKKFYYYGGKSDGKEYKGDDTFVASLTDALGKIYSGGKEGKSLVSFLANNKNGLHIAKGEKNQTESNAASWITYNPNKKNGGLNTNGRTRRPAFIGLAHELAHAQDTWNGTQDNTFWFSYKDEEDKTRLVTYRELYASFVENQIRGENNVTLRQYYLPTVSPESQILKKIRGTYYPTNTTFKMLKNLFRKTIPVQPDKTQVPQLK